MKKTGSVSRWAIGFLAATSILGLAAYRGWASSALVAPSGALSPVDVVVFAPHPDDEVLGCGGVVQQALASGKTVRIVFSTLGDAYAQAAAKLSRKSEESLDADDYLNLAKARMQEALDADRALGVDPKNVIFLGYPDGALEQVAHNTSDTPITSRFTGRAATYGPIESDFHSRAHGEAAPYTRASVLADFVEVLQQSRPSEVYVTDRADAHPDHRATGELVHAAMAASGHQATLRTFLVHSAGRPEEWPWPTGPTPQSPFQQHTKANVTYPAGVPWPPSERVALTAAQSALKLEALTDHRSQWVLPSDHALLGAFIKSEEIFWTGR